MKEFRKVPSLKFLYEINKDGLLRNVKSKKILKPEIDKYGYKRYNILKKHYFEHRLVAECWVKNKPDNWEKLTINHKDANKLNNNYKNLEYITRSANSREASIRCNLAKNLTSFPSRKCKCTNLKTNEVLYFESGYKGAEYIFGLYPEKKFRTIQKNVSYACLHKKVSYNHKWEYIQ